MQCTAVENWGSVLQYIALGALVSGELGCSLLHWVALGEQVSLYSVHCSVFTILHWVQCVALNWIALDCTGLH